MLTAASSVIPLGLLSLRPLQIWMNRLGLHPKHHRDKLVTVTTSFLRGLQPWKKRSFLTAGVRLGSIPSCREVVTTNASLPDGGPCGRTAQGAWDPRQAEQHINLLELRAVTLALKHFLPVLAGRHVFIRIILED